VPTLGRTVLTLRSRSRKAEDEFAFLLNRVPAPTLASAFRFEAREVHSAAHCPSNHSVPRLMIGGSIAAHDDGHRMLGGQRCRSLAPLPPAPSLERQRGFLRAALRDVPDFGATEADNLDAAGPHEFVALSIGLILEDGAVMPLKNPHHDCGKKGRSTLCGNASWPTRESARLIVSSMPLCASESQMALPLSTMKSIKS
jgi:hypothetical protein